MKNFLLLTLLLLGSCGPNGILSDIKCSENDCAHLNPLEMTISPASESIEISFSQTYVICLGNTCLPEELEFHISENNEDFEKVATVDPFSESFTISDLEDGKEYFVKMVSLHCALESIESAVLSVTAGEVKSPRYVDQPLNSSDFDFRLSPNGDDYIYRSNSNAWYLSSFTSATKGSVIYCGSYQAQYNPSNELEVAFLQSTQVENSQGHHVWRSKILTISLDSGIERNLHEIPEPYEYWINEFRYSSDGRSIYFVSNKDNGGSSEEEKRSFNNLWKLDLESKEIEAVTDFLPIGMQLYDFIEDPKQAGNFYVLVSGIDSGSLGTYYYTSFNGALAPILLDAQNQSNIAIDPMGNNLVFASRKSGQEELWSYNLGSKNLKQLTNRSRYSSGNGWNYLNWISDNEFMVSIEKGHSYKLAIFEL